MSKAALLVSGVLSRVDGRVLNCAGATLLNAVHVERGRVYTIYGRRISSFSQGGFFVLATGKTTLSGLQGCRYLEKMDLEECVLITDATLIHLAMGCPRIECLVSFLVSIRERTV